MDDLHRDIVPEPALDPRFVAYRNSMIRTGLVIAGAGVLLAAAMVLIDSVT